jgi:hypothetical protein
LKTLLFFLFSFCFPLSLLAQQNQVSAWFAQDTVLINSRNVISSKLKLHNGTNKPVTLKLTSATGGNLLTLPDTVTIQPSSSRIIPVKFFPSAELLGSSKPVISIVYTNVNTTEIVKAILFVQLELDVPVGLTSPDQVVYINNITGKAALRFRCVNRGYASIQILLKLNINPAGLQVIDPVRVIKLEAGSEQMIEFDAAYLRLNNNLAPEFNVMAEVTNMSGSLLATSMVQVTSLTSRRADINTAQYTVGNTSGVSYTQINQANTYYTITGNGNLTPSSHSQLDYNLNLNYYNRLNTVDAYDTWVGYNNKNIALRAGNIMDNLDFSMFGRGIKFSVKTGDNSTIDAYGLQNNYLLYTQAKSRIPLSSTYALNYNFKSEHGLQGNVAAIFNTNPFTNVQTRFVNGRASILRGKNHELDIRGGASYETAKNSNVVQPGAAAGADYTYRNGKLDISLNNYFSTAYYSGLQRGVLQLNERLSYRLAKAVNIFGRYSLLNNKPLYMVDTLLINQGLYSNMVTYEAGINFNTGKLSLTIHPYLFDQSLNRSLNDVLAPVNQPLHSSSKRVGADLIYSLRGGRQLYILSDFGITNTDNPNITRQLYNSLRVMATYSDKWWGLHALIQKAPYYLSEETIASQTNGEYSATSFGPEIHFAAFKNKLNVNVSSYFNYTSYNKNSNNSLNAQLQYHVKNGWAISGQAFYNTYSKLSNNYNLQTRVGIVKQFIRNNAPGTKKLKVNFYNDANNNNKWDDGEPPVEGVVVSITQKAEKENPKQLTTITGKKGDIEYVDLKKGYYSLMLVRTNGWHLPAPVDIDVADNKKIAVPLVKSGWLTGKINVIKKEFIATKPLLEGIKIIARSDQNTVFTTLTNENGEFELPLPINRYHISADVDTKRYTVGNQGQMIAINKDNNTIEFNLTDESRKVIVKQF